jgi:hypothetical protein
MKDDESSIFTLEEKVEGIEDMKLETSASCTSSYLEKRDLTAIDHPI